MKIFHNFDEAGEKLENIIISIGNFDGIHLGHQKILNELYSESEKNNATPLVVTFTPHPISVLAPDKTPPFLTTFKYRLRLMQEIGIKNILLARFNKAFAEISAEDFIEQYLINKLHIKQIVIGENYFFGKNKQGDINFLNKYSDKLNYKVKIVPSVVLDGETVSSSAIRNFIQSGDMDNARKYLGRDFSISGKVVAGDKRGQQLGFPTANLQHIDILIPPDGVYFTNVIFDNKEYDSITNIGIRPTFNKTERLVETHILNFNQSLYNKEIIVIFKNKIRDEKKFSSALELKNQITKDIEKISLFK